MEFQTTDLPPDVQYVLDSAGEVGEITAAANAAIHLYADRREVMDIVDRDRGVRWPQNQFDLAMELEEYGQNIIRELPPEMRTGFVEMGFYHIARNIHGKALCLSDWNFTDATVGGATIKQFAKPRLNGNGQPTPKTMRRLRSRRAIRSYIRKVREVAHARAIAQSLASIEFELGRFHYNDLVDLLNQQRRAIRVRLHGIRESVCAREAPSKRVTRQERGKIKRAASIAAAVLGASSVSAFARGEPVMIRGEQVAFSVSLSGGLAAQGHSAVRVGLHDLNGKRLSGLCVYYPETPALDQLAAMALDVSAGAEDEIIATGNLYELEKDALDHPVIKQKYREPARSGFLLRDPGQLRVRAYQDEMIDTYIEVLATEICGARFVKSVLAILKPMENYNGERA